MREDTQLAIQRETLEVEFVTPCFLGGSEKESSEWRAASVRGQLRWWLRAIAGSTPGVTLEAAYDLERELFGDTERGSLVRIRARPGQGFAISHQPFLAPNPSAAELAGLWGEPAAAARLHLPNNTNALAYLAFGPITGNHLRRSYLRPGTRGFLDLTWIRTPGAELRRLFDQALWAWLHLGGIGSKSRKGYGSLQPVPSAPSSELPAPWRSRCDFLTQMKQMLPLPGTTAPGPEWTRFSPGSRIFLGTRDHTSWEEALSLLGTWLIAFRRRYGHAGETRPGLANRDYDWLDPANTNRLRQIPDRAGFGLPLPFRREIPGTGPPIQTEKSTVTWNSDQPGDARRASPLLLHVAHLDKGYVPVLTYLPARFLPAGAQLRFKGKRGPYPVNPLIDTVVPRFLDDLKVKKLVEEVF